MTRIRDLHTGWVNDPAYRKEYDALEGEFALAAEFIRARASAGLTQEQLAERMGTKQEGRGALGRWKGDALDAHPGAACGSDRHKTAHQLRAVPFHR